MVHTLPDYTTKYRMTTVFGNLDTGEIAARLGSPDTYDRRGAVIWYDDFNSPTLKWRTGSNGAGYSFDISTAQSFRGDSALKITTPNVSGKTAYIYKSFGRPAAARLGYEVSFTRKDTMSYFLFRMRGLLNDISTSAAIKYIPGTSTLQYEDIDGNYQTFATDAEMGAQDFEFCTLKFVADFATHKYARCMFTNKTYDLSSYAMGQTGAVATDYIQLDLYAVIGENNSRVVYIDDLIFTNNEP